MCMEKRNYPMEYEIVTDFIKNKKDKISKGELNFLLGYAANIKTIIEKTPKKELNSINNIKERPSKEELKKNILLSLKELVDYLAKGEETQITTSTKYSVTQMLEYIKVKGDDVSREMLERISYEIDMLYYMYDLPMRENTDLYNYLKERKCK